MNRSVLIRGTVTLVVAAAFTWGAWQLLQSDPKKRSKRPASEPPAVDVQKAEAGTHALLLSAQGTVQAAESLEVRPQVGGRLQSLHAQFEPGAVIRAGETLYQIDRADYQLDLKAAEAALAKSQAGIDIERGRRKVAAEELRLLKQSVKLDRASRSLALRGPQLKQVQAEKQLAENAVEQAQLQLSRTSSHLPYDVVVLERQRVAGAVLAAREVVGKVARADRFRVELRIPARFLAYIKTATDHSPGSTLTIHAEGHDYQAKVSGIRAQLSEGSRLAGIYADIEDPLSLLPQNAERPPLLIGSYVSASIDAGELQDVVLLQRHQLQSNQRVWVVDAEQQLQVRDADVVYAGPTAIYIRPLKTGDRVLSGRPSGLVPGTLVRPREPAAQ